MPKDSPKETKELKKVGSFLRLLCSFAAHLIGSLGALGHSVGRSGAEEQRGQSFLLFSAFSASVHLCGEVIGALGPRLAGAATGNGKSDTAQRVPTGRRLRVSKSSVFFVPLR